MGNKRGFGSPKFDKSKHKEIAALGGTTAHRLGKAHRFTSEEGKEAAGKRKKRMGGKSTGRMPIQDEYTNLPVSRQRKWQLRHKDDYRDQVQRYYGSKRGRLMQQLGYYRDKLNKGKGTEKDFAKLQAVTKELNAMPGGKKILPLMSRVQKNKLKKELFK